MEKLLEQISNNPVFSFTIVLAIILTVPPIFERFKLPGLVGLLVAGIVLGPHGFGLLNTENETIKLFSEIGKIYLMFVAGLEIDLAEFRKTRNRSLSFGFATFIIPLITGSLIGFAFGFGPNASILIGSLLASHTLLGYPIINRLGVAGNEAVTVTVGATIFTDIAALLVLAICIAIHAGEFSIATLVFQLVALAVYSLIILFGFDWAGKEYFRRTGDEESNQFLFILLALFLASVGAQLINVDRIVGAFLAGLAVNDVVGRSPLEEKIEFVGSTLFIPFFFVGIGLLLNIPAFISTLTTSLGLTLAIVGGLIGSKFLAALVTKISFRYNWNETFTMWSLSLPQVAATLAAAFAGLQAGLLNDAVFNTVIVLMIVTALLGPILTARFGSQLPITRAEIVEESFAKNTSLSNPRAEKIDLIAPANIPVFSRNFSVVVALGNPLTQEYLLEMAAMLARHQSGVLVPLAIAKAHVQMDEPDLAIALKQSQKFLQYSENLSKEYNIHTRPKIRIDDDIAEGISRTAREENASLIVMGWGETMGLRARLFGNVIDSVFWASHCPVAVTRLLDKPTNIRRILVPLKNLSLQALRTVRFAQLFANTNQAHIEFLHICDRHTPSEQIHAFQTRCQKLFSQEIKVILSDKVAQAIVQESQGVDLVVLRSLRRRTVGGLAVSDVTTQVIKELTCSLILFGEPHS